jgi:hypothetical protein
VRGYDNTENMDWYGKIKKIIALDFPNQKEVVIFQCDWYDVPAADKKKSRGYNKDQYGIIDIDTTKFRYLDDLYILGSQAEQVFYVKGSKKLDWCTVVRMKPRNLFAMPEGGEEEGEIDLDSLIVGVEDMNVANTQKELNNWRRSDIEGVSGDANIIQRAFAESVPEPNDDDLSNEEDDTNETYIDDGLIAPVNSSSQGPDDDFFA